jgi:hypothetical protein
MKLPTGTRALGWCGIAASLLMIGGGFFNNSIAIALSGLVMFAGNVYAAVKG